MYYTLYRLYSHYTALQGSKALEKGFAALDAAQLAALRDQLLRLQAASGATFPSDSWPAKLLRADRSYLDILDRLRQRRQAMRAQRAGAAHGGDAAAVPAAALLDAREGRLSSSAEFLGGSEREREQEQQQELSGDADVQQVVVATLAAGEVDAAAATVEDIPSPAAGPRVGLRLLLLPSAELSGLVRPWERAAAPLSDEAALAVGKACKAPHVLEHVARARRRVVGAMFPADAQDWTPPRR